MKKIIYLLASFVVTMAVLSSCSNDDGGRATYTFNDHFENVSGVTRTIVIFEYNERGTRVGQQSFSSHNGLSRRFEAQDQATRVTVQLTLRSGLASQTQWIANVFYLRQGGNVDINMTHDTQFSHNEPR